MSDPIRIVPDTSIQETVNKHPAGSTFLITKGTYYGQMIAPRTGDIFLGEPGTIMDGTNAPKAFAGQGVKNVTIDGIAFTGYNPPGSGIGVLGTDAGSSGWHVVDCDFYDTAKVANSACIMVGNDMLIERCLFRDNPSNGIGGWNAEGVIIRHCEFHRNHLLADSPFGELSYGAGIKIAQCRKTLIEDCYVHDTVSGPGIWTDISCVGTRIENNIVFNNEAGGIYLELDYGAIVRGNFITVNNVGLLEGFAGGALFVSNSQNIEAFDNIMIGNGGAVRVHEGKRGAGNQGEWLTRNVSIHGNVIVADKGEHGLTGSAVGQISVAFSGNTYRLTGSARFVGGPQPWTEPNMKALTTGLPVLPRWSLRGETPPPDNPSTDLQAQIADLQAQIEAKRSTLAGLIADIKALSDKASGITP